MLAHELGHHVHRHILKSIAVQAGITFAAFWAASLVLQYAVERLQMFETLSDFANLPLLVLVSTVLSFLLMPALNAYSRYNERQADRYAVPVDRRHRSVSVSHEQVGPDQNLAPSARLRSSWSGFFIRIRRSLAAWQRPRLGAEIAPRQFVLSHRSRSRSPQCSLQNFFHPPQVFFRVHAYRVISRLTHVDRDSIFQKPQLLQPLASLQHRFWQPDKTVERVFAIGIETKMLEHAGSRAIPVVGHSCAGEIESAPSPIRHHLYRVRIVDVRGTARSLQRVPTRVAAGFRMSSKQRCNVLRPGSVARRPARSGKPRPEMCSKPSCTRFRSVPLR